VLADPEVVKLMSLAVSHQPIVGAPGGAGHHPLKVIATRADRASARAGCASPVADGDTSATPED
jgi:hypothetical protein